MSDKIKVIKPSWQAPSNVIAYTTTRIGGVSPEPYEQLNLGNNTQDSWENIEKNRQRLQQQMQLPHEPAWLEQVHKTDVVEINANYQLAQADASFSRSADHVCVVLTADCLPILLCAEDGTEVAAIHAGWRSLVGGVIENTIAAMHTSAAELMAWLGPCISAPCYEIGTEVYEAFTTHSAEAKAAFTPSRDQHWFTDLPQLATQRLQALSLENITASNYCTFSDSEHFYSYRREQDTGRMASLIYLT